ncbi:hypothetical protein AUK11_00960 [bacterium CG2_30_37_16]|nr:MAG: hypothetical protein AUK11_00960 [bacterium CG2_30_37_16]PIP30426.1 MAG: hypothetical protein COX25_04715 [bacterium (Candidatus Howlettbacteria) CG23_combo_of_CG06-09_8_20_14_all_37_9]PIX99652.1 MAG: hypothetical protein COZ22_02055 [bacterium (Candidatus Howlettbacteria) CG_4_10_14_3_um_filter_37_10]PJB06035.1 MAG: hypothetical protein CO123_02945 [bacterium (Candidatus Howlettbacteria) CG_4_9_14_3_um_filter_37_10]
MDLNFIYNRNLRKWLIVIIVLFVIAGLSFYIKFLFTSPEVESITPKNEAVNVSINETIIVRFNRRVSKKQLNEFSIICADIKPQGKTIISGNYLKFIPDQEITFLPSTTYKIKITPISSLGRKGKTIESTFTTAFVSDNRLTSKLKEQMLASTNTLEDGLSPGQAVIKLLPYSTSDFSIDYEVLRNGAVILNIKIKGNDKESSKQKALKWITDSGSELNKFEIRYIN